MSRLGWTSRGCCSRGGARYIAGEEPRRGFVARSWDYPFAVVAGEPAAGAVRRAVEDAERDGMAEAGRSGTSWRRRERAGAGQALPGWRRRGVTMHRFAASCPRRRGHPRPASEIRVGAEGWSAAGVDLSHLPDALRHELAASARRRGPWRPPSPTGGRWRSAMRRSSRGRCGTWRSTRWSRTAGKVSPPPASRRSPSTWGAERAAAGVGGHRFERAVDAPRRAARVRAGHRPRVVRATAGRTDAVSDDAKRRLDRFWDGSREYYEQAQAANPRRRRSGGGCSAI